MFNPGSEISSIAFDKIIGGTLNAVIGAQNQSSLTTVNFIKSVGFVNDEQGNTVKPIYVDFKYPKEIAPYEPGKEESFYIKVENCGSGYNVNNLADTYTVGGAEIKVNFVVDGDGRINAAEILEGIDALKDEGELLLTAKAGVLEGMGARLVVKKRAAVAAKPAVYQDMTLQVPILTIVPIPFIRIASTDLELNVKINSVSNTVDSTSTAMGASVKANAAYKGISFSAGIELNASISHQKQSSSTEEVKKEYSLNIKIHAVQDDVPPGMSRILDVLEETIVPKRSTGEALVS